MSRTGSATGEIPGRAAAHGELMRDFYRNARAIYELTELVSERLALPIAGGAQPEDFSGSCRLAGGRSRKREEFDGFHRHRRPALLSRPADFQGGQARG